MKFYKSIVQMALGGAIQIRDPFGNVCATFARDSFGERAYHSFCKGFGPGDELYDKDYNRLMIGNIGEMIAEDQKCGTDHGIAPYVRDLTPREVALNAPTDIKK